MWEMQSHEALQTKYKQWYNNYIVIVYKYKNNAFLSLLIAK